MFAPHFLPTDIICEKHNFRGAYCIQCDNEHYIQQGVISVLNGWNHVTVAPKKSDDYYCFVQGKEKHGFSQYHKILTYVFGVWVLNDSEKVLFWRDRLPDPINK